MRYKAEAILPFNKPEQAVAPLRARLQTISNAHGFPPDWGTFALTGPSALRDARGMTWFKWSATVALRSAIDERRPAPPANERRSTRTPSAARLWTSWGSCDDGRTMQGLRRPHALTLAAHPAASRPKC